MMSKILIVSNRLPITVEIKKNKIDFKQSVGGLTTGIASLDLDIEKLWIGWPGADLTEKTKQIQDNLTESLNRDGLYPVFLNNEEIEKYYYGFCNETIWPLFHYFVQYAVYNEADWNVYKEVNQKYCEEILKVAKNDDIIWIHDYHLMLLPNLLREKLPGVRIGFFLHIPFPSSEIFRLIPWCREIIEGLLGSDLLGFHTFDYVRHFGESVRRILGVEHSLGLIKWENRAVRIDTFPMGIDYEKFSKSASKKIVKQKSEEFYKSIGAKKYKIILSIDRLDYSKGIPNRLEAFDHFLENNSKYRNKVLFILVVVPSRIEVDHYNKLKVRIDNLVGKINGKYGTLDWEPIRYLYRSFDFNDLVSLYSIADVLFITPIRDGMNLVAKEYVATKRNEEGVLILGEMAGTAKELGEAIVINPHDTKSTSDSLLKALDMPKKEQKTRMTKMRGRLRRYNVKRWASDFLERLNQTKEIQNAMASKELSPVKIKELIKNYKKSKDCLFLLDYDGTLMPFNPDPKSVYPDNDLKKTLSRLSKKPKNEVVIISGRDRKTLDSWLGKLSNGMVGEHGIWFKETKWKMIDSLTDEWKKEILPILDIFVDRTPGSFVEEKNFSLAWHYRKVDPALALVRVGELKDILSHITANLSVGVLEGNKVIEVKFANVNKGNAALKWVNKRDWDFIFAIGDDWTDEDIYDVLPDFSYSIKVGYGPSKANYNIANIHSARQLIKEISLA